MLTNYDAQPSKESDCQLVWIWCPVVWHLLFFHSHVAKYQWLHIFIWTVWQETEAYKMWANPTILFQSQDDYTLWGMVAANQQTLHLCTKLKSPAGFNRQPASLPDVLKQMHCPSYARFVNLNLFLLFRVNQLAVKTWLKSVKLVSLTELSLFSFKT